MTIHQLHMHLPGVFYCDYRRLQNLTGTRRYSEMNVTDLGFPANLAVTVTKEICRTCTQCAKAKHCRLLQAVSRATSLGPAEIREPCPSSNYAPAWETFVGSRPSISHHLLSTYRLRRPQRFGRWSSHRRGPIPPLPR